MKNAINLRGLDSLRGLLAVYVLAGHARWLLWAGWETWRQTPHGAFAQAVAAAAAGLRYGHEAVMVFFVLSGFFIHFRAAQDLAAGGLERSLHAADFFRRRAWRLVPPYAFALLLTACADAVGRHLYAPLYLGATGDPLLDANLGQGGYTMRAVAPALCLLPGSGGRSFGSDGPLWSLGYEIVYYLLYPTWLACRRHGGAAIAYGLGAGVSALGMWMPGLRGSFVGQALAHYPVWLAGAALVEFCARGSRLPGWSLPLAAAVAIGGFAGTQWRGMAMAGTITIYALAGAAAVLFFAWLPARCSDGGPGRFTEKLGLCSYTIYICHFPLLTLASAAAFQAWGQRPLGGFPAAAGGLLATGLCALFYLGCERPFLTRRRQQHLRPAPA